jgi:hypothetical protein
MSSQNNFSDSYRVNAAMSRGRVVALSSNAKIDLAGCDETRAIGVLQEDVSAEAYENAPVRFLGTGSVMVAVTGTPLTAGDTMVLVTSGFVSVTNGRAGDTGVKIGILKESAAVGSNGQLREVIPQIQRIS